MTDTRYPYTDACDFLRSVNPEISRSDVSQIRHLIANVLNMDDTELAKKLADFASKYESEVYIFKDEKEKIEVPKDAISFRIITLGENKFATWLKPKKE